MSGNHGEKLNGVASSAPLSAAARGCVQQAERCLAAGELAQVREWLERALDIAPGHLDLLDALSELAGQPKPTEEVSCAIDSELRDVRDNWNEFGKRDALWSILTVDSKKNGQWDLVEFFGAGEREISGVMGYVESLKLPLRRGKALDFGCGVGRLTQALCRQFEECHGVDIAESMVELAHQYNRFGSRCHYHLNVAHDLRLFAENTFDFVYSNIVLQHNKPVHSRRFIQEFLRILAPGGVVVFQIPSEPVFARNDANQLLSNAFRAELSVPTPTLQVEAGSCLDVRVKIKNASSTIWPAARLATSRFALRLGNHWLNEHGHTLVLDDGRTTLINDLPPGGEVELRLSARVPTRSGAYVLELDLVQESVAWFKDKGSPTLKISVQVADSTQGEIIVARDAVSELHGWFRQVPPATTALVAPAANENVLVPRMDMNGIPKAEVIKLLELCGGRIIDITEDNAASGWLGFRYCVMKPELNAGVSDPISGSSVPQSNPCTLSTDEIVCYVEERRHASHAEFVALAYQDILGRGLDEAGYSNWLTKLNEGFDRGELVASFANSSEAQALRDATQPLRLPVFDRATPPPLPPRSSLEQYQDVWVRGAAKSKGVRQCADRFELIRNFCAQYQRPFTVLDLGCNLGYFSLRLAETFDCTVVAAEGIYGDWTEEVMRENGKTRVILLKKIFTLADLRTLAAVEHFDVVLALSVVHHLDGTFDESLEVLRSLGDHLIMELPFEENACGPAIVQQAATAQLPAEAQFMGLGKSHLAEGERPFYSLSRPKTQLLKSYLGTPRTGLRLTVHSSFTEKRAEFANKSETRAWHRGINLQTYLWFNGAYPARHEIAQMVQAHDLGGATHRDIQPWNVLLQGDEVQFIDYDDPNHAFAYNDSEYRDRLVKLLLAGTPVSLEPVADAVCPQLQMPVRWAGPIFNPSGYASEAINFLLPLSQRATLGLYHHNNIYSEDFVAGLQESDRKTLFALRDEFENLNGGIAISHNPANGFMRVPNAEYHVGRTMFETDRISPVWVASCNQMDEIWVPSRFNVETFAASGVERDKLFVVPEAVDEQEFDPDHHTPLPLPNRAAFNFLSIFEWSSRKGWDVLLSAYLREFSAEDDVCLYLRTYLFSKPDGEPSEALWKLIREHAATLGLGDKKWPRIELIANQVPLADLPRLYRSADCLVAPSRGEGWGRPHHEAMMMGLPVIATNWSGNTEFMNAENSYLLDYELADINQVELELWHYRGQRWANPSESHLRELMRQVQQNPAEAREKGSRARAHMLKHFSRGPVVDQVVRRLQAIEQKLTVPSCPATTVRTANVSPETTTQKRSNVHVAWEGTFLDLGSLSHVNREITRELANEPAMRLTRVGKNVLPANLAPSLGMQDIARGLVALPPKQTQVTVRHSWPPSWERPASGAWVLVQPWEFGALPAEWLKQLARVDEVWAPSEYVRRVYVESGVAPQKVKVVPNGIDPERFHPNVAPLKLGTTKSFKFLFVGGTIHRKGPDLLLQAFLDSFTAADDVCLVIKDFGGQSVYAGQTFEAQIKAAQSRPNAPEIFYLNEELSPEALPGLYTACDCLVHPYRGEGFGLPVLEAMACGLSVVVTGGGSTDDFATDEFAYRLPALRKQFGDSISGMKLVKPGWLLEPDANALAERMKWIAAHRDEARAKGSAASDYVRREWTWNRAAKIAGQRLQYLVAAREAASGSAPRRTSKMLTVPPVASFGNLNGARELLSQEQILAAWNETIFALSVRPYHPEAFLLLAEIARAAGDSARAKKLAEHACKLAPKWKPAQQFLKSPATKGVTKVELPPLADSLFTGGTLRLTVCLITKNEERFLDRCLESIRDIAQQIIVMDTGSTDRTVEIAQQHGVEVFSFAWCDDFSAARNAALERATGDWILMLDADEELLPDQREKLRKLMQGVSAMAFRLPMIDEGREEEGVSYVPRLFRNAPGLFYTGCVHEHVFLSVEVRRQEWGLSNKLGDATLLHHGYTAEVMQSRGKSARNLKLLQKALGKSPDDPNLLMNLGLELARAGRLQDGIEQYDAAFRALSALPANEVVPEFRETLLTQFCTHLVALKDFGRVARVLRSPLARTSGLTATLHWLLGLACIESKSFAEGAEQMRQCLATRKKPALSPVNKNILRGGPNHCLALCLAALKQHDAADQAFRAALQEEPTARPVRLDYARFLAESGQEVEALNALHQLVTEDSSDVRAWHLGGHVALSKPEFLEFACDWTGEAVNSHADQTAIIEQRAIVLLLSGKADEALPLWKKLDGKLTPCVRAALIICEALLNCPIDVDATDPSGRVDREFVVWYRRLLGANASQAIETINKRMESLRHVVPEAVHILEAALAETS